MSRDKGKRGEREWAAFCSQQGYECRRTAQYCGKTGEASDDEVIYLSFCRTSSNFRRGTVVGVTEKCAYIDATRKEGHKIISLTALERRAELHRHFV